MTWPVILFAAAAAGALAVLLYLKAQIRGLTRQLEDEPTRKITLGLMDRDLTGLAASVNQSIAARRLEARRDDQRQRQLKEDISNIAHDLRTPLTSVRGYVQLLEKTRLDDTQRDYVKIIADKAETLNRLIRDFYDISYWDQADGEVKLEEVNLGDFVSEHILACRNDFESKGVAPVLAAPPRPVLCYADVMMLTRIIQNLVGNALEHGQGDVEISLSSTAPGEVSLSVRNAFADGNAPDPDRVFDRLYTGDSARTRPRSGLGLPVVRLLAEKMGGAGSVALEDGFFVATLCLRGRAVL
jgi:signal transduction histidine kinase